MNKTLFRFFTTSLLLLSTGVFAQQLNFSYDEAGNQTKREWVCINCPLPRNAVASSSETSIPVKVEMKLADTAKRTVVKRTIIASPNPLLENLNVNWETESGISVKSISVFAINGMRTHEVKPSPNQNGVTLPFQQLATGMYILYITFSDQRKESIKVIKK